MKKQQRKNYERVGFSIIIIYFSYIKNNRILIVVISYRSFNVYVYNIYEYKRWEF